MTNFKYGIMTNFKYGIFEVECISEGTRSGFRHLATLYKDGVEVDNTKICYLNRTWESFEFESVINKLMSRNADFKEEVENLETIKKL